MRSVKSNILGPLSTMRITSKSEGRFITPGPLSTINIHHLVSGTRPCVDIDSKIVQSYQSSKISNEIKGDPLEYEKQLHFRTRSMAQDQIASINNYKA